MCVGRELVSTDYEAFVKVSGDELGWEYLVGERAKSRAMERVRGLGASLILRSRLGQQGLGEKGTYPALSVELSRRRGVNEAQSWGRTRTVRLGGHRGGMRRASRRTATATSWKQRAKRKKN